MIRYQSTKQVKIEEFSTPFEMNMNPENRWVKLASKVPWDELAAIYHQSLDKDKGAPIKDARLVIGALIIKHMLGLDDRGVIEMISENPYMQYFIGRSSYTSKPVFSPVLFVHVRRRLGPEAFDMMNQEVIMRALGRKKPRSKPEEKQDDEPQLPNQGKLQIDATIADADVKYPTDVSLLNESRLKAEEIIDVLYKELQLPSKPRTYRRVAKKEYVNFSKKKKPGKQLIRKAIRKQLAYLGRNIRYIHDMLDQHQGDGSPLDKRLLKYFFVIQQVHDQQQQMYKDKTNSCKDRIVNIHQPHVRPMVRGKAGRHVEFGAKINVSLHEGYGRIDRLSWDPFHEGRDLIKSVENFRSFYGHYPELVQVDGIYLGRDNRQWLKSKGIRHTGKPLGRPPREQKSAYQKTKDRKEAAERNQIEGTFGYGKRKYGLNLILAKTQKTSESWISAILFVMNLTRFFKKSLLSFLFSGKKQLLNHFPWLRYTKNQNMRPLEEAVF